MYGLRLSVSSWAPWCCCGVSWQVEVCQWAPEQGPAILLLIWESGSILQNEPYQSLSVVGAQTPSRSMFLNIYCTQGIMHLFKCIINAFKCVRLYQNTYQSLPVRPRVTSLTEKLLLAYWLAFLLSERAITGFIMAVQSVEVNPGYFRCPVQVQS